MLLYLGMLFYYAAPTVNAVSYAAQAVNAVLCCSDCKCSFLCCFGCLAVTAVSFAAPGVTAVSNGVRVLNPVYAFFPRVQFFYRISVVPLLS
jgi:hypothetical protein